MFDYFKTLLGTFPAHQHRANWQSTQMKSLILLHVSYTLCAENSLIVFHSFQHSGSFLINHVYKCNILEAAPDLQHDHNFTKCAQQQIKQYLDSISYDVDVMHEFTDGCSSQYKSRHCYYM
jgi:hypothetical protein